MIGLKRGVVVLKPYNKVWNKAFEQEASLISEKISDYIIEIQHIGSTAIHGIVAKPIIDLAVAINSLSNIEKIIEPLNEIDFIHRGEQGIPGRHLFVKGDEDRRTHHMHVMEKTNGEWRKHIVFRDYLISHPSVARKYGKLKMKLFKKHEHDREKYTDGKSDFIQKIVKKAIKNST